MTSAAKIRADRRNALRSTGPRSLAGKAIAARRRIAEAMIDLAFGRTNHPIRELRAATAVSAEQTRSVLDRPEEPFYQNEAKSNNLAISAAVGFSLRPTAQAILAEQTSTENPLLPKRTQTETTNDFSPCRFFPTPPARSPASPQR